MSKPKCRRKKPPHRKHHPKRADRKAKPPLALVDAVATALNACHQAGIQVWLDHDLVWTRYAVVLPPFRKSGWAVRPLRNHGRDGG